MFGISKQIILCVLSVQNFLFISTLQSCFIFSSQNPEFNLLHDLRNYDNLNIYIYITRNQVLNCIITQLLTIISDSSPSKTLSQLQCINTFFFWLLDNILARKKLQSYFFVQGVLRLQSVNNYFFLFIFYDHLSQLKPICKLNLKIIAEHGNGKKKNISYTYLHLRRLELMRSFNSLSKTKHKLTIKSS